MSARLVIQAEISTSEDLFETIKMWLAIVPSRGSLEVDHTRTILVGLAQGIQTEEAKEAESKGATP